MYYANEQKNFEAAFHKIFVLIKKPKIFNLNS